MTSDSEIPPKKAGSGISPRQAAWLSYGVPPFTGLFFLLTENENLNVRFHAWHSIIFGCVAIAFFFVWMVFSQILGAVSYALMNAFNFIGLLIALALIVVWAALLHKARQGDHLELPILTDLARSKAQK